MEFVQRTAPLRKVGTYSDVEHAATLAVLAQPLNMSSDPAAVDAAKPTPKPTPGGA